MTKTTALLAAAAALQIIVAADVFRVHFLLSPTQNVLLLFASLSILFNALLFMTNNESDKFSAEAKKSKDKADELQNDAKRLNETIERQKTDYKQLRDFSMRQLEINKALETELGKLRGTNDRLADGYLSFKTGISKSLRDIQDDYSASLHEKEEQIEQLNNALRQARMKASKNASEKTALEEKLKRLKGRGSQEK